MTPSEIDVEKAAAQATSKPYHGGLTESSGKSSRTADYVRARVLTRQCSHPPMAVDVPPEEQRYATVTEAFQQPFRNRLGFGGSADAPRRVWGASR